MKQLVLVRSLQRGVAFLKKRPFWRYTLILTLFLVFAFSVAAGHDAPAPYHIAEHYYQQKTTRYVTSWRLNLREGPNTGFRIITKLKHDDSFVAIGQTESGEWLLVEAAGQTGWVWREYTTPKAPTAPQGPQVVALDADMPATKYQGYVTSFRLNLREGPSTDYKRIRQLINHESMYVLGRNETGTWLYVRANDGSEGWVWSEYVRLKLAKTTSQ